MSDPTVQSLLDELVSQVEQGNVEAAKQVLRSLVDRFDELRENEQLEVQRSSSARRSQDSTNETVQNLTEHILAASETQVSRGAFLLEAVTILSGIEDEQNQNQDTAQVTTDDGATKLNALGERLQNQQSDYDDAEANVAVEKKRTRDSCAGKCPDG
jgi:restriction endonuclease Mrr